MSAGFFRKSALEKLSTPEKLDQLIKITDSKSWIALITIALALGTGVLWSVLGKVKTKLDVIGVIQGGEVHEVVSTSQGQLIELKVSIGDRVSRGDIIATLEQPELRQQIEDAQAVLNDRTLEMSKLMSYRGEGSRLQKQFINQSRKSIEGEIAAEKKKQSFLSHQLQSESELLTKGLITKSQVENTRQQIEASKNTIERLKGQFADVSNQEHDVDFDLQQKVILQNQRIAEAQRNLDFLIERYKIQKEINSPYDGEVVEVLTDRGVVVGAGTPLFKVKNDEGANQSNLSTVLYIPAENGKKIKSGMEALVAPSTIKPQEYGFIKGRVTYVSDFPVTQQGMLTSVKNDQLAKVFLASGPLFEVHVDFEKDSSSFSGFKWTSAKGPNLLVKEGTSCLGKITIKEERPITIVIPAFKKFFDLY